MTATENNIPIIDLSPLLDSSENQVQIQTCAQEIAQACRKNGFFYVKGHGVSTALQTKLETLSRQFFELPEAQKMQIAMEKGGRAWRGYFPLGNELTSGKKDQKEGIYFGRELSKNVESVQKGIPLHGPNLFPEYPSEMKREVLEYMTEMEKLGHIILKGIALSLGLQSDFFQSNMTYDPTILFRIFHYPKQNAASENWGVGAHSDYGLLTILKQDENGGLEIYSDKKWISAPPIENTFVCNIGDMLDKMTGGLYKSTLHRVKNTSGKDRLSFPFFFDPAFDAPMQKIKNENINQQNIQQRWDQSDIYAFEGTYGDYLIEKVSKVFPELKEKNF